MVYKIISEWRNKDGSAHELIVYRYNYSWDCKTVYSLEGDLLTIKFYAQGKIIAHSEQLINDMDFEDYSPANMDIMEET